MKKKTAWLCAFLMAPASLLYAADAAGNGIPTKNLDLNAHPGTDFSRYATGGWADAHPIPDEFARFGSFDLLRDENQRQIRELVQTLATDQNPVGSAAQKIGDLYRLGNDSLRLNREGATPIAGQLQRIGSARNRAALLSEALLLRTQGVGSFFGTMVGPDDKNSSANIFQFMQGGLNMGEREDYLNSDETSVRLRQGYHELIVRQFQNAGFKAPVAQKAASAVMKLETRLAKSHFTKEKSRVPELNYHKMRVTDLDDSVAVFDWEGFLTGMGAPSVASVNICQVEPVAEAVRIMNTEPVADLKHYLQWCLIREASPYLSDDFVNANFDFFGRQMSGARVIKPRWKRVLGIIDRCLGEEVGRLYTARYFPAEAKTRMLKLVDNLKLALGERIDSLAWMSEATKAKAHEKLNAFIVKIGYPDQWRDYTALSIGEGSYWDNICRSSRFEHQYAMSKLSKPADKMEWQMTPQTVNAYYNPTTNEICFPAGILQPPFFYLNADDAVNYGAIGVVIGHEMSHGFDDQGSKYDKDGNLSDWWTAADAEQFNARTKVLADYFDGIKVLGDLHANGTFTLGENIADNGGLQISHQAFRKTEQGQSAATLDGFTPAQRFFLAYANLWAGNVRDAEIIRLTKVDPHSLGRWRINGALPHMAAWYDAFGIPSDAPLYLAPERRASIW